MNRRHFLVACAAVPFAGPALSQSSNPGAITMQRVTFTRGSNTLVGDLHLPERAGASGPAPAVVVTGAWMTVKEQMPARYAGELAGRGFVALAFDFTGWGQSGGARRQVEDPSEKIADIEAAVAFLASRPEVDPNRIAGLGICASSGYMAHAAVRTTRLASIALVAPWLHDREIVVATYGGPDAIAKLEAAGASAQASYARTGQQPFVPAASSTDSTAIMGNAPYYTESNRGMIPAWRNEVDPSFWPGWLRFDAIVAAPRLRQPFLMVHSEAAAIPQGAHRFFAQVTAPKRELWLDGVTQFDFYDRTEPVRRSADAVAEHFGSSM